MVLSLGIVLRLMFRLGYEVDGRFSLLVWLTFNVGKLIDTWHPRCVSSCRLCVCPGYRGNGEDRRGRR